MVTYIVSAHNCLLNFCNDVSYTLFKLFIILGYTYGHFACRSVYIMGMSDACEGQKKSWDPLELDIEIVVNLHVDASN